jgi:ATP dependent DNA ligase domain
MLQIIAAGCCLSAGPSNSRVLGDLRRSHRPAPGSLRAILGELGESDRKKRLIRLVGRRTFGIVLSGHTADDGATIYRQACAMGLEGIVSKRLSAPYRSGPSRDWLKVKNPDSPAMIRAREVEW